MDIPSFLIEEMEKEKEKERRKWFESQIPLYLPVPEYPQEEEDRRQDQVVTRVVVMDM